MISTSHILKQAQTLVAENAAQILCGTSIVGTVSTAVLSARAGFQTSELLREHEDKVYKSGDQDLNYPSTKEKVIMAAPLYIPAVGSMITTITAIVFGYRITTSKSAALAAAYGISEKALQDYKDKVAEKVTPKKQGEIKDAIAEEYIRQNPPPSIIVANDGEVVVLDSWSGIYFKSTVEKIKRAENAVNAEIINHSFARLAQFYDELELEKPEMASHFGWNTGNMMDLHITTAMSDDEKPIVIISHNNAPQPDYEKEYLA